MGWYLSAAGCCWEVKLRGCWVIFLSEKRAVEWVEKMIFIRLGFSFCLLSLRSLCLMN